MLLRIKYKVWSSEADEDTSECSLYTIHQLSRTGPARVDDWGMKPLYWLNFVQSEALRLGYTRQIWYNHV